MKDDVYFYKTIYDKRNPQILYSTGVTRIPKEEHKFTIHHSTDGGDTWSILYQADLLGVPILVEESSCLIFFPIKSSLLKDCCWIKFK